ncbi:antitoxin [Mycobacterium celatum]|uniref:Antitoxin n=2 Tax=Mycobacterium celatum TaxID=28045 RepID=A0A1X1RLF9_MYCCE|nr:antitoxin [Mycobacterium celatum]ORV08614.1 antitoxin [Mycobacterium celatum]PIB78373.1 antitoxin [Mycobacterium celatum]
MIRTQIQLPDELYRDAKRVAQEHEMTLAEVVRRGLEHMVRIYPKRDVAGDAWQPPAPRRLGPFRVSDDAWRELANEA